jgi:hypothetical protein
MVKSNKVVRSEKKMKALATKMVGMLNAISGVPQGSH